jgi:tRNA-dihydrouridine synthase B
MMGAGLVHTEMVSAAGLSRGNGKTLGMLGGEDERPLALQLFGPDADCLARAAEIALGRAIPDALEINMACPMPKVTKKCGGASLLSNPGEAARIVAALKRLGPPVWVKTRKTERGTHPLATDDFCREMLSAGADLLIVHGRTPAQRYEGEADKAAVVSAAKKFPGMVAATGDFYEPEDAEFYLGAGCAAVLAARGVLRDAFLIPKTLSALGYPVMDGLLGMTAEGQMELLIAAARRAESNEGASFALVTARRLLRGMLRGVPGVSALRQECSGCGNLDSMERALRAFTGK